MRFTPVAVTLALLVAGCGSPYGWGPGAAGGRGPRPGQAGAPTGVAAMAAGVDPAKMDLPTYERLTAEALAEALATGDVVTARRFVTWADGPDPQPASSQAIAKAALDQIRMNVNPALAADITRVAAGGAKALRPAAATGIAFPADEGAHATALTEWWYVNGHLDSRGIGPWKSHYGYEFTLFKIGPLLHWTHVAITDAKGKQFHYARQFIKPSEAKDGVGKLDVAYGAHQLVSTGEGAYALKVRFGDEALELSLAAKKAPLLIGGNGKIDMPEGKDSWYYSQTRMEAHGAVTVGGKHQDVNGVSWIDHQWGPFFVSGLLDRWDWFSLQFDDGTEYNLFAFRDKDGNAGKRHVNRSAPDGRGSVGTNFTMDRLAWWKSPVTGLNYTTKWKLDLPETQESVDLEAMVIDQEVARRTHFTRDPLPHYWEGAMKATKRRPDGKKVEGVAYCEHFGFAQPAGPR